MRLSGIYRLSIWLIALCAMVSSLNAQVVFPVQATTSITPPYSLSLEDYTSAEFDRFRVNILLSDLQASNYPVKFRLTIEGPDNMVFQSKDDFWMSQSPIILDGGVPQTFTGFDLKDYFNTEHLNFPSTYTRETYEASRVLKEGLYIFKLEIFDAASVDDPTKDPIEVSNAFSGLAVAVLTRNDPPFLNTPQDNQLIEGTSSNFGLHSIPMSWTPRHVSINSSFNTTYKLRIVEVIPTNRNPYDAINTSTPIFESELTSTAYNFHFADAALIPEQFPIVTDTVEHILYKGKKYAWQIQAVDESGKDIFKNGGFSEVYTFFYADPCEHPEIVKYEAGDAQNIFLQWIPDAVNHSQYEIYYKPMGSSVADRIITTTNDHIELTNLEPSTTYEISIKTACDDVWTDKKRIGNVTTTGNVVEICEAPSQTNIEKDGSNYTFKWETISGAESYIFAVKGATASSFTEEPVIGTSYSLTLNTADLPAVIRIDAQCKDGGGIEIGDEINVDENTDGFVGICEMPVPLNIEPQTTGEQINLSWSSSDQYIAYDFKFRTKDSQEDWKDTLGSSEPLWENVDANFNILYEYQVKFYCSEDQFTEYSSIEYFVVEREDEEEEIDEGTGDCFEPPVVQHEVREHERVKVQWDQVDEAASFELYYKAAHLANWQMVRTTSTHFLLEDLLPETDYVYKVRSECEHGFSEFTGEGQFNTGVLNSTRDCPEITLIAEENIGTTTLSLSYEPITEDHESVIFFYKKSSQSIADWYQIHDTVLEQSILIAPLSMRTDYDVKAQAVCGIGRSHMSESFTFTTGGDPIYPEDFVCGAMANECPGIDGTDPNTGLAVGDKFLAHDFEVEILDIYPGEQPNYFGGVGKILVGYPNDSYVQVDFDEVYINTEGCLIAGRLVMTGTTIQMLDPDTRDKINTINSQVDGYLDMIIDGDQIGILFEVISEVLADHSNLDSSLVNQVGNMNQYYQELDSLYQDAKEQRDADSTIDQSQTMIVLTTLVENYLADLGVYNLLAEIKTSLEMLKTEVENGIVAIKEGANRVITLVNDIITVIGDIFSGGGQSLDAIGDGDPVEGGMAETKIIPAEPVDTNVVPKGQMVTIALTDALRSYGFKENMSIQDVYALYNKAKRDLARADTLFQYAKTLLEDDNLKKLVFEIQKDLVTVISQSYHDLKTNAGNIVSGISLQNLKSKIQDIRTLISSIQDIPLVQNIQEGDKAAFKQKLLAYLESKIIQIQQASNNP